MNFTIIYLFKKHFQVAQNGIHIRQKNFSNNVNFITGTPIFNLRVYNF